MHRASRPTASRNDRARRLATAEAFEPRLLLTTFTVTTAADAGPGSLREAILAANAGAGDDVISFSISTGPQTIRPLTLLPAVQGTTVIDGRTQPGWQGTPLIQIDGPGTGQDTVGLDVRGERSQLLDLSVTGFGTGIRMSDGDRMAVAGCYVGLDPAGAARPNQTGIELANNYSTIGFTPEAADGNVISGNYQFGSEFSLYGIGLFIRGHQNTLTGNRIGTNVAGTAAVPNGVGMRIWGDANHVGTAEASAAGRRNLISGNREENLLLEEADGTFIQGNYIGTDVTGNASLGGEGLQVLRSADVTIGGTDAGAGNLITANIPIQERDAATVLIDGEASARAVVRGNLIGMRADGLFETGTGGHALVVRGAPDVVIGGTTAAARNVIGRALGDLIRVEGATARNAVIQGNYLGVNAEGDSTRARGTFFGYGIAIAGAPGARVGGAAPGAGNVVANCRTGIGIAGEGARVQGNYVGTNADGTVPRFDFTGNETGVWVGGELDEGRDVLIGGAGPGEGNLISGNQTGVQMRGRGTTLAGNRIGTTPDGAAAAPNLKDGIEFGGFSRATGLGPSVIGGTAAGAANVISGNGRHGLVLRGEGLVVGNLIGVAADGVTPLGNRGDGVRVELGSPPSGRPIIGGTGAGEGNVIARNNGAGVQIGQTFIPGLPPPDAAVLGNRIFANGGLGIDAGDVGVTPNDMPDTAAGPQNFPVLSSVVWGGSPGETGTRFRGTLDSEPNTVFRIELFSSRSVDPTGYGEGETFVAATQVVTDAAGHAEFDAQVPAALTQDDFVTATATKVLLVPGPGPLAVRTSEFSRAVQAVAAPQVPPRVQSVNLTGASWSRLFGEAPAAGTYPVPGGAAQLRMLPWLDNNKVVVRFNRDVAVEQSDLRVRGVNRPTYGFDAFAYDPIRHTATWTLDRPDVTDKLMLELASGEEGVRSGDAGRLALDGEWANGADAYPSGDGAAGGDFRFRLNLVPGDATGDGSVDALDLAYIKQRLNRSARSPGPGPATYTVFADLNADSRINALDISAARKWLQNKAPAGEPAQTAPPAAPPGPAASQPAGARITGDYFAPAPVLPA